MGLYDNQARIGWDELFFRLVHTLAARSPDPNTKVGAVIVAPDKSILATGYNGAPRGVEATEEMWVKKPEKYWLSVHCETNAILNAGRQGVSVVGSTLYVSFLPCNPCARNVIQAGITEIKYHQEAMMAYEEAYNHQTHTYSEEFKYNVELFRMAGVTLTPVNMSLDIEVFYNGKVLNLKDYRERVEK